MLILKDEPAVEHACAQSTDYRLTTLLRSRVQQLLSDTDGEYELAELATFIVIEANDTSAELEAAANYPIVASPAFEWVVDHGGWFEGSTILSDDGFGIILLVPDREGVDATLLALLRDQAVMPQTAS
jgi:hypothetical protein